MTQVLPNKAASDEAFKALETANLDDFFVQRLPAGKRRMYLGLFKYSQAAHRRIATLKKAGIKAMVRLQKTVGSDFFLVVRGLHGRDAGGDNGDLRQLLLLMRATGVTRPPMRSISSMSAGS